MDAGWMLAFIIPPLNQKKKNKKVAMLKSERVGAYRHKYYYRCVVGLMAMKLFFEDLNSTVVKKILSLKSRHHMATNSGVMCTCSTIPASIQTKDVEGGRQVTHLQKCAVTLCAAHRIE